MHHLLADVDQLLRAMGTGVALADGFKAARGDLLAFVRVAQQATERFFHLSAVVHDDEVLPGAEEVFKIGPGPADERAAARERLEDADGGDAAESVAVLA